MSRTELGLVKLGIKYWLLVRDYWIDILFFLALLVYYVVGTAPDITWLSLGGDGFDYVVGAKHFWAVRPTGYPVIIMLGWIFEHALPGNDFWKLGLLSSLCCWLTCIFIFLIVRWLVQKYGEGGLNSSSYLSKSVRGLSYPLAPYAAALCYAGSFLVWTQSQIPQSYPLMILLMVMAIYFCLKEKWIACSIVLAVGVGTHFLISFVVFGIGAYAIYRQLKGQIHIKLWLYPLIICLGFISYLQCHLCVSSQETTSGVSSIGTQSFGSLGFIFGLPLNQTWGRIIEAVPITLSGLGVGIVAIPFLLNKRQKLPIYLLLVLALSFFVFYFFSNIPMWVLYMMPFFAFASILVGYGLTKIKWRYAPIAFIICPLIFMGVNMTEYSVGKTIDPAPTGARQFLTELDTLPNGSLVYFDTWSEPWLVAYYYWSDNPKFIIFNEGQLRYFSDSYSKFKESQGVVIPGYNESSSSANFSEYGNLSKGTPYYMTWNTSVFLKDLQKDNPNSSIYVCRHVKGTTYSDLAFVFTVYNGSEVSNEVER